MAERMLSIEHVSKKYVLGQIGGTTLRDELQRVRARLHHREDPTAKIGSETYAAGETFHALSDVSFDVMQGERVGIIGHNGAGKSTLLKLISRVTAPTEGRIRMNGRVASMLEVGTGFHGELTGRENIYMNGAILGMKKREIDAKMEDIIEFSECRKFIDTPVKRYSSGMYVKLAFSVAAHLDAEIMIMDEVLAVGDMAFQNKCLQKMNDVSRTSGRTILYVSHNMNTIRQLCERCIVLDHGRVVFNGGVEEAIAVYMGMKAISQNRIELRNLPRTQSFLHHPVTMTVLEMLDSDINTRETGTKLRFRLGCTAEKEIKNAFLRTTINSADGTPVTMLTTDHGIPLVPGQEKIITFTLDTSRLVPGRYTITPVIYEVNEFGANVNLDHLMDVLAFQITPSLGFNNNMIWQTRWWGYTFQAPIQIESVENVQ